MKSWADAIRNCEDVEERVDFVGDLFRVNIRNLSETASEAGRVRLEDLVALYDSAICLKSTGRHADKDSSENSPKDAEMIAELEEEVKDKEEEIKRLGDG